MKAKEHKVLLFIWNKFQILYIQGFTNLKTEVAFESTL